MKSVLQDWVMNLPLKQQSTLISALRGPDNLGKHNTGKQLTRYLRSLIIVPANPNWKDDADDTFLRYNENSLDSYINEFIDNHDEYPHHFIMHLVHAFEIVGYKHKTVHSNNSRVSEHAYRCLGFYCKMAKAFHMIAETEEEMDERLADVSTKEDTNS